VAETLLLYNSSHADSVSKDNSRCDVAFTSLVSVSLLFLRGFVLLFFRSLMMHSHYLPSFFSNKNKAKGSNIGDAIVELLLYGGMPASVIEARLVDGKKLELGAGGNQNKCVTYVISLN
jgi:hypothetical protein